MYAPELLWAIKGVYHKPIDNKFTALILKVLLFKQDLQRIRKFCIFINFNIILFYKTIEKIF